MSNKQNWPLECERQEMKAIIGSFTWNATTLASVIGDADQFSVALTATGRVAITFTNKYLGVPTVLVTRQSADITPTAFQVIAGPYTPHTATTFGSVEIQGTGVDGTTFGNPTETDRIGFMIIFQDYTYGE